MLSLLQTHVAYLKSQSMAREMEASEHGFCMLDVGVWELSATDDVFAQGRALWCPSLWGGVVTVLVRTWLSSGWLSSEICVQFEGCCCFRCLAFKNSDTRRIKNCHASCRARSHRFHFTEMRLRSFMPHDLKKKVAYAVKFVSRLGAESSRTFRLCSEQLHIHCA